VPDPSVAAGAGGAIEPAVVVAPGVLDLDRARDDSPVVGFVNRVLRQAIEDHASDIHFEPFEDDFKIRYRIDGALHELAPPPRELAGAIASRVKVLAQLDIAERRVPQDGRIKVAVAGRLVDLRVATLPTEFGESLVLRVLDQEQAPLSCAQLGLPADIAQGLEEVMRRPNGILIVTGPTGSGKTTTLYSALRSVNTLDRKLLTAEDPVEYELDGILQLNVGPGLPFAGALRAFLRQDPDVMMIGEIRDLETAQVAMQASLTGHLVLSTLHTTDALGAVTRLIDLGVEPFLIASALEAVLAQRLVRRICPACREAAPPDPVLLQRLQIPPELHQGHTFFRGAGCPACHGTGYRGRMGLFEWLRVSEPMRELIGRRAGPLELRQEARAQGWRTLREDGLRAVFEGATTLEEVGRYC
jgi:type IV pilus assembly protein PilB